MSDNMKRPKTKAIMQVLDAKIPKTISQIHTELRDMNVDICLNTIRVILKYQVRRNKVIKEDHSNCYRRRYKR